MAAKTPGNSGQGKASRSSGPKTAEGKEIASHNATKHGILSRRLFLDDENPKEFYDLLDDLMADLRPVGRLERFMVERMAITIWRQHRLFRAEAAQIEMERQIGSEAMRTEAERMLKRDKGSITREDFQALSADEERRLKRCQLIVTEYQENKGDFEQYSLDDDLSELEELAPTIYGSLSFRAITFDNNIGEFLKSQGKTLATWTKKIVEGCERDLDQLLPRQQLPGLTDLLRVALSTPEKSALVGRYQTSLDNDLYKALKSYQETQEWRHRVIEQDTVALSGDTHEQQEEKGNDSGWQDDNEEEWRD